MTHESLSNLSCGRPCYTKLLWHSPHTQQLHFTKILAQGLSFIDLKICSLTSISRFKILISPACPSRLQVQFSAWILNSSFELTWLNQRDGCKDTMRTHAPRGVGIATFQTGRVSGSVSIEDVSAGTLSLLCKGTITSSQRTSASNSAQ